MNKMYAALENLVWVAQLGVSIIMPLLLCLALCWWLVNSLHWGGWVYVPGILLGLGGGGVTFADFAKRWMARAKKEGKKTPPGFNRH